jgi:iron complex transport system ATP-binding protein
MVSIYPFQTNPGVVMNLSLKSITCGYPGRVVLEDVSFSVEPGEVVCLLGPNGVGKTTLFRTILGLHKPSAGEVTLAGKRITEGSRKHVARLIGYVPQAHTPPFPFGVLDVVLTGRTAHLGAFSSPGDADVAIAEEALDIIGAGHLRDRIYTEVSGGERQMVLIARALAQEPQFLVMDEPSSNLDYGNQIRLLLLVRQLAEKRRIGVVMSSHFPNHAFLCASRVGLLQDGRLLALGESDNVMTEAGLERLYGIPIDIVTHRCNGHCQKICTPKLDAPSGASPSFATQQAAPVVDHDASLV